MADVQPLRTLRYEQSAVGSLDDVIAPPYDVIDEALREELAGRSPFNVVEIDLPVAPGGGDPYMHAAETFQAWEQQGILVREREPAVWALEQEYAGPTDERRHRRGFFARVRVEDYGAGRIRPHERTHPGPKEDRLRLTRATRANLSPIFSLFPDPDDAATAVMAGVAEGEPFGRATDHEGTENTLWRVSDPDTIAALEGPLASAELLIADGHHRYETARVYAEEVGGEGEHRYVLMLLCSLADPGLTVFPTHRLLSGLADSPARQEAIREAVRRDFEVEEVAPEELEPAPVNGRVRFGYMDSHLKRPFRLTLKDQAIADRALEGRSEPYRRLDTAVLEALILQQTLGMTEEDISHFRGLDYARSAAQARERVESGEAEAAFFMGATPVSHVRDVAAAGKSMPPKSTYFFPKVLTGMVFNPLSD